MIQKMKAPETSHFQCQVLSKAGQRADRKEVGAGERDQHSPALSRDGQHSRAPERRQGCNWDEAQRHGRSSGQEALRPQALGAEPGQ